jgi:hypothetical protein
VSAVLAKNGSYKSTTLTLNDDGTIAVGDLIEDDSLFKGGMPWQIDEGGEVGVAIGNKQVRRQMTVEERDIQLVATLVFAHTVLYHVLTLLPPLLLFPRSSQPQVVEFMDVDSFKVLKSLGEEDIFGDVKNRKLGSVAMGR